MKGHISPWEYHYQTLTVTMELLREEPQMSTKMSPPSQNITPTLEAREKTQQMSKSEDLQLTYLQQFKHYPLPLIPLKSTIPICQSPQPL